MLRREDGHVLRRTLEFEVEGHRKKGRLRRTWKKQIEEERCEGWFEKGICTLTIILECWCYSDCCWVEVNLATLTCWGYYQNLNIDVSLSVPCQPYRTSLVTGKSSS